MYDAREKKGWTRVCERRSQVHETKEYQQDQVLCGPAQASAKNVSAVDIYSGGARIGCCIKCIQPQVEQFKCNFITTDLLVLCVSIQSLQVYSYPIMVIKVFISGISGSKEVSFSFLFLH